MALARYGGYRLSVIFLWHDFFQGISYIWDSNRDMTLLLSQSLSCQGHLLVEVMHTKMQDILCLIGHSDTVKPHLLHFPGKFSGDFLSIATLCMPCISLFNPRLSLSILSPVSLPPVYLSLFPASPGGSSHCLNLSLHTQTPCLPENANVLSLDVFLYKAGYSNKYHIQVRWLANKNKAQLNRLIMT